MYCISGSKLREWQFRWIMADNQRRINNTKSTYQIDPPVPPVPANLVPEAGDLVQNPWVMQQVVYSCAASGWCVWEHIGNFLTFWAVEFRCSFSPTVAIVCYSDCGSAFGSLCVDYSAGHVQMPAPCTGSSEQKKTYVISTGNEWLTDSASQTLLSHLTWEANGTNVP